MLAQVREAESNFTPQEEEEDRKEDEEEKNDDDDQATPDCRSPVPQEEPEEPEEPMDWDDLTREQWTETDKLLQKIERLGPRVNQPDFMSSVGNTRHNNLLLKIGL